MGQKVNPHGLRVGVIKDWDSRWYAEEDFADNLAEDYKIRELQCLFQLSVFIDCSLTIERYDPIFGDTNVAWPGVITIRERIGIYKAVRSISFRHCPDSE